MEDTVYFYINKLVNKVFFSSIVQFMFSARQYQSNMTKQPWWLYMVLKRTQLDSRKGKIKNSYNLLQRVNATSGGHVYWGFKKSVYFLRTNFQAIIFPPTFDSININCKSLMNWYRHVSLPLVLEIRHVSLWLKLSYDNLWHVIRFKTEQR